MSGELLRIGEAAKRAGVTNRTLRYYQEVGLLSPGTTPGGTRVYDEDDVERIRRILELRDVMGFDLDRIKLILASEDRLAQLRAEAARGPSPKRHQEMVAEAIEINARVQEEVNDKIGMLHGFLAELKAKERRYRDVANDLSNSAEPRGSRSRVKQPNATS
jgi:MerR family transcriptional regulator, repressor of the yfmOP operon